MDEKQIWQQPGQETPGINAKSKHNKRKNGLIIAIVIPAVVLIMGIGAFCLYHFVFHTPEVRLAKGLAAFSQDIQNCGAGWRKEVGLEELMQNILEENTSSTELKLNVTLPETETLGIDSILHYDGQNRQMEAELALSFFNIKLLEAELAADAEKLYVSVPEITEEWYSLNTQTLGADYQDSFWAEMVEFSLPEDFGFSVFDEKVISMGEDTAKLQEEWIGLIEEYASSFAQHATIEDMGDKIEIKRAGKTIRCGGVFVMIEKDVFNDFLSDFCELYEEYREEELPINIWELSSDLELCFYLDNKDRIVRIETVDSIEFEDKLIEEIEFSFDFLGTENVLDEISGTGKIVAGEEGVAFEIERYAEKDDNAFEEEWILTMAGDDSPEVVMEYTSVMDLKDLEFDCKFSTQSITGGAEIRWQGAFDHIKEGESITFNLDKFLLKLNSKDMYKMTGSITLAVLDEDIKLPEEATDLMRISEMELLKFTTGLVNYLKDFRGVLSW